MKPTTSAIGTWSGGRFMHFGEPIEEDRLNRLLTPDEDIQTVITADVYGTGDADLALGRALKGLDRDSYCLAGTIGHDFYEGKRQGAKGFPRFTDPQLRGEGDYASYLRMATERSLERCGVDHFDLLMLHNPDSIGYRSEAVWEGMEAIRQAGLTELVGVAPGPANGFTLDIIDCLERFGATIDWAMIILGPLEPWPGEFILPAAQRQGVEIITRVVDYGGIFHDDVLAGHDFPEYDHRRFRPDGWVEAGRTKLERMRPLAERHGLTMLQLACLWCLGQPAVGCVVPTLIQEGGEGAKAVEDKRAELAALKRIEASLSADELAEIRAIGDNSGSMALKGASLEHEGSPLPDRWAIDPELSELAERWSIDPERDLAMGGSVGAA